MTLYHPNTSFFLHRHLECLYTTPDTACVIRRMAHIIAVFRILPVISHNDWARYQCIASRAESQRSYLRDAIVDFLEALIPTKTWPLCYVQRKEIPFTAREAISPQVTSLIEYFPVYFPVDAEFSTEVFPRSCPAQSTSRELSQTRRDIFGEYEFLFITCAPSLLNTAPRSQESEQCWSGINSFTTSPVNESLHLASASTPRVIAGLL